MLDYYYETERQFIEFSRIIPLDNDGKTYSPMLYTILQSSCSQVETMLKLLCERFEINPSKHNFWAYYDALNKNDILQTQSVYHVKKRENILPFELYDESSTPVWWNAYNSTKHKLPEGMTAGNIINTVKALAGIYVLHCMAHYAQYGIEKFFEKSCWSLTAIPLDQEFKIPRDIKLSIPRSEVFFYTLTHFEQGAPI